MMKPAAQLAAEMDGYEVDVIDEEEGRRLVDERARELLGMSGDEFIRRLEANEIPDPDRTEVRIVSALTLFMRQSPNGRENAV